ncbi:uncharacterized protein LOC127959787 isoform X1 [Carassius gibelio]|uniref:uncharacterized protein LOC127959787 isoform X1 n=1 Tax=Carassius gibelio TaxID=101364 RepID=UPI002278C0D8|nr:uncharacterized protein LOC127959787 isoform X1 [Carassius gibelio]
MDERFAFLAEWYDPSAALLRRYQLLYYPKDGSVEMVRPFTQISGSMQRTFTRNISQSLFYKSWSSSSLPLVVTVPPTQPSTQTAPAVSLNLMPSQKNMVDELCSGPCMALEIHAFQEFCGPADPVSNKMVQSGCNVYLFPWGFLPQKVKLCVYTTSYTTSSA